MKTKHKHWAVLTASTLGLTGLSLASGLGDEKYTYDASGNVSEKQIGDQVTRYDYTGNQLNGSTSDSGSKQYDYDSSGRLSSDSEAGKPIRNMEHQYLDKVTKVQDGDKTTEFFYNADGQLVATNSAGNSETFAWDGLAMVNRGEQLYVNEDHVVGGAPAIVGHQVSVSDMIGSSLSIGKEVFQSSAFGEGLDQGLFTGKPFINELEGYQFMYRVYSANDARWVTSDPSGYPDGINNSTYVNNGPLASCDTLGLSATYVLELASGNIAAPGKVSLSQGGNSGSFSFSGAAYSASFNAGVTCTATSGNWPQPASRSVTATITHSGPNIQWNVAGAHTSFSGDASGAIRMAFRGANTDDLTCTVTGAVAIQGGSVANYGAINVPETQTHIIATYTGTGDSVNYGNVQYKTREL